MYIVLLPTYEKVYTCTHSNMYLEAGIYMYNILPTYIVNTYIIHIYVLCKTYVIVVHTSEALILGWWTGARFDVLLFSSTVCTYMDKIIWWVEFMGKWLGLLGGRMDNMCWANNFELETLLVIGSICAPTDFCIEFTCAFRYLFRQYCFRNIRKMLTALCYEVWN